jgi:hypothetical protein
MKIAVSKIGLNLKNKDIALKMEGYAHPLWLKYHSSDTRFLIQIFVTSVLKSINLGV